MAYAKLPEAVIAAIKAAPAKEKPAELAGRLSEEFEGELERPCPPPRTRSIAPKAAGSSGRSPRGAGAPRPGAHRRGAGGTDRATEALARGLQGPRATSWTATCGLPR